MEQYHVIPFVSSESIRGTAVRLKSLASKLEFLVIVMGRDSRVLNSPEAAEPVLGFGAFLCNESLIRSSVM